MQTGSNGVTSNSLSSHPGVTSGTSNGNTKSTNGTSHTNGTTGGKFRTEEHFRDDEPQSDYHGHDREEVTRLIIQTLGDMGYNKAADLLQTESGFKLESIEVARFRRAVLGGEWNEAEELLDDLEIDRNPDINALLFILRQQKFLELLEIQEVTKALHVLRNELTPLRQSTEKLHFLSSLMMFRSPEDLKRQAKWDGARGTSRSEVLDEISKYILPASMIPQHRLATLLHHVKREQLAKCLYHNSNKSPSLYTDHSCSIEEFPSITTELLADHNDEVYCVKFSHDGTRMATASKDKTIIIWDVETWDVIHIMSSHTDDVTYIDWSPDDQRLVSCSKDKTARLFNTENGREIKLIGQFEEPVSSICWAPNGQSFVLSFLDEFMLQYNPNGELIRRIPSKRLYDVKITPDGTKLVVTCTHHKMHVYNFQNLAEPPAVYSFEPTQNLTGIALTKDSKYVVINTGAGELIMVDLETGEVVKRFVGQVQDKFVIRGCLGGADENFVLSGSEDSTIYVWKKETGELVEKLAGHNGIVNCVHWNPVNPYMFASSGDDRTVRIWSRTRATPKFSKGKDRDSSPP
ncbi:WD40-repeat-containing domain protein [Pyronema omphalodes]|nr:WD40-repeat-containing domain protein [Pyronema omphalodes]